MNPAVTRLLILGGTAEARALAAEVVTWTGVHVVSSLAGRVRDPRLPLGEVRVGGFGGADGLAAWLIEHRMDILVDATHPYASRMRVSAAQAAAAAGLPYLRLERPGWTEGPGDRWLRVPDVAAAAARLPGLGRRVFLTTGRQQLDAFTHLDGLWFLARVVDEPSTPLPAHVQLIRDRGPYTVEGERDLLSRHGIDVLVTKDSGGDHTSAKLTAARALGCPVVMVDRPNQVQPAVTVTTVADAITWLTANSMLTRHQAG